MKKKKSGSNDLSFSSSSGTTTTTNNKVDRKTVEKNRRIHMKGLCFKLASLIPRSREEEELDHSTHSKDAISQHDHLDRAADYIKKLTARIEKLKQRKKYAAATAGKGDQFDGGSEMRNDEFGLPVIEVRYRDSILEVVLITGLKKKFMFYQLIQLLQEEGAEVVNASFSVVGEKIFHTIHSQVIIKFVFYQYRSRTKFNQNIEEFEFIFHYRFESIPYQVRLLPVLKQYRTKFNQNIEER